MEAMDMEADMEADMGGIIDTRECLYSASTTNVLSCNFYFIFLECFAIAKPKVATSLKQSFLKQGQVR